MCADKEKKDPTNKELIEKIYKNFIYFGVDFLFKVKETSIQINFSNSEKYGNKSLQRSLIKCLIWSLNFCWILTFMKNLDSGGFFLVVVVCVAECGGILLLAKRETLSFNIFILIIVLYNLKLINFW